MARSALADGSLPDHPALLSVRTRHDLAGVEAGSGTGDADLADQARGAVRGRLAGDFPGAAGLEVIGVSVEPVVADAGPVVVVRHAESVGPAQSARTGVYALAEVAVLELGAHLVVPAVGVVRALGHRGAAHGGVVRVVS